jgi:hypothetical protein
MASIDVAQAADPDSTVVEMDCSKPNPKLGWKAGKQHFNIVFAQVVLSQFAGLSVAVGDSRHCDILERSLSRITALLVVAQASSPLDHGIIQ